MKPFVCFMGLDGSGKSTLLNMLAGLEKPTKGEIVIAGCHIEELNEKKLQQLEEFYNLLVTENKKYKRK